MTSPAAGPDDVPNEKKKRSGASQFRRKRISHPLDPNNGGSTPRRSTTSRKTKLTPKIQPDDPDDSNSGSDGEDDDDYIAGWKQVNRSPSNSPLPSSKSLTSLVAESVGSASAAGASASVRAGAAKGGMEPQSREVSDESRSQGGVAAVPANATATTSFAKMKKMGGSTFKDPDGINATKHDINPTATVTTSATITTATTTMQTQNMPSSPPSIATSSATRPAKSHSLSSSSSVSTSKLVKELIDNDISLPSKRFGVFLLLALFLPFLASESVVMYLFYQYKGGVVNARGGGSASVDPTPLQGDFVAANDDVGVRSGKVSIEGSSAVDPMENAEIRYDRGKAIDDNMDDSTLAIHRDDNATNTQEDNAASDTRQTDANTDIKKAKQINKDMAPSEAKFEPSRNDVPSLENDDAAKEGPPKHSDLETELKMLRSMLRSQFRKLQTVQDDTGQTVVDSNTESICHMVWNRTRSFLSEMTGGPDDTGNDNHDNGNENASLRSLMLDSQKCMGGEILSGLSKDVDEAKLQMARDIFERLSHVDPYDIETQAGLGTCLLLQAIFSNLKDESDHISLLTLATFHLKVASSLCSGSKVTLNNDGKADGLTRFPRFSGFDRRKQANASQSTSSETGSTPSPRQSHVYGAAILHNLALAYIALGDSNSSVPVLLRAAALRRETVPDDYFDGHISSHSRIFIMRPYWNMPEEVLLATEEKALLMAAKTKTVKREKKRRIPFLSIPEDFNFEEMAMGI